MLVQEQFLPNGVMLNAYPNSIGAKLSDTITLLQRPEFKNVFSLFYILPTFFHSDLDRGFSINSYDRNDELVSPEDLAALDKLNIVLKFDLVLNHLSVRSRQFLDMLEKGDRSKYRDFFVDWNKFWEGEGELGDEGYVIPNQKHLDKLFMRKPGLPILMVRFPDGTERPYWNTFYQHIRYRELETSDLQHLRILSDEVRGSMLKQVNAKIATGEDFRDVDFGEHQDYVELVADIVESKRRYLGQMDLNAESEVVWEFYDKTLKKLADYGGKLIRLDAFAYLHKKTGLSNFFNKPGTWEYLDRLKMTAESYQLSLLPEIHAQYGTRLHNEISEAGYPIYDFFLPGLLIDALDRGTHQYLRRWLEEIQRDGIRTINMLGCHDGIPVHDLAGAEMEGHYQEGLLAEAEIEKIIERILARGGRVKNLFGPDGKKIAYYQVNATYFSALGEDEQKLRLARAIQLFMPGIPQVWYLDLFAGKNDYAAADRGGTAGHKEINRTTLTLDAIEKGMTRDVVLDQLEMMRLRNMSNAFNGTLEVRDSLQKELNLIWKNGAESAALQANLETHRFSIHHVNAQGKSRIYQYPH